MKKLFTTDIPTKLLALAIAFFLWVYLMVLLNPEIETSFSNIPITYSEHSNLVRDGYVITSEPVEAVSLKLRGPRNMLANVNKNNISAYIDLTGCSEVGAHSLPIHVRLPYEELSLLSKTPYNVSITVDKVITRSFDLDVVMQGVPKNKYHIDTIKSNIKTVSIEGPSELIKSIDSVVSYFNVDGIDKDKTGESKIIILNNRGETIKSELLTISHEKAEITCSILAEKVVSVDTDKIIVPDGFEISSVTPAKVTLIGRQEILDTIESVKTYEKWLEAKTGALTEVKINIPQDVQSKETSVEIVIKEKTE